MVTDWNTLRPLNGSRDKGFEELSCQLAAGEPYPSGSKFIRKGVPDAGVECYWILPGGDEHGWQAKFFTGPPTSGQWSQINDSVKTALDKHPRLTRYTVCLPIDRSDARVPGQKSLLDKWNQQVKTWKQCASRRSMSVEFEYWGDHELTSRLNREENRGRHWFWFQREQLSLDWFRKQLDVAVRNAGERYTPVLHIDLPIAKHFAALGRTPAFHEALNAIYVKIRKSAGPFAAERVPAEAKDAASKASKYVETLCGLLDAALLPAYAPGAAVNVEPIDWKKIRTVTQPLADLLHQTTTYLWAQIREKQERSSPKPGEDPRASTRHLEEAVYYCREFLGAVSDLLEFCDGAEPAVANQPALLLVGEAGQGKTHLLCDIAEKDLKENRPRILLHGAHFTQGEPWYQIIKELGLNCTTEEFLGALEAAGQAYQCRILLLIDALNEGEGRGLWENYLAGMLGVLAGKPWVGIAVSVRSSYEDLVIPKSLVPNRLTRVMHRGFEEHEYEAVHRFFVHYGIQPTSPLLLPEFSNPLFLKLFCQGIKESGWPQVPLGLRGITAILDMFLEGINAKLSRPDRMDYDRSSNPVRKAVDAVVERMADIGNYWLPRDEAIKIVGAVHPVNGYDRSLFRNLVSEGVLAENRWKTESGYTEVVSFAYERFGDHLVAKHLLDHGDPKKSFGRRTRLGKLLKTEAEACRYAGMIEALSIHLPERVGRELFELVPHAVDYWVVRDAFLKSLVWRDAKAFSAATHKHIQELSGYHGPRQDLLNTLLTLAPVPDHPLNAEKLHAILSHHSMPHRDAWWSIFVHGEWGQGRAVNRLVDWTLSESDKSQLPDSVVLLMGTALAWLFTTSNRFARDRATKALVRLTENRLDVLCHLVRRFWSVDDPYVLERILAAGYGAAMRSRRTDGLNTLAQDVAQHVFQKDGIAPQLLTRDYAGGIIACARHRRVVPADVFPEAEPPYKSQWPAMKVPSVEVLEKWGAWREKMPYAEWAQHAVYDSIMGKGLADFSRYVIGGLEEWTSVRLGSDPPITTKQQFAEFLGELNSRQRKMVEQFQVMIGNIQFCKRLSVEDRAKHFRVTHTDEQLEAIAAVIEQGVIKSLRKPELQERFRTVVKPYIEEPHRFRHAHSFNGDLARRWMVQRVIDYGWTADRFGEFDHAVNHWRNSYRESQKAERIGKKYQWIAFRELLARLSDNFYLRRDRYSEDVELHEYSGIWDLPSGGSRDIDPAVVIAKTHRDDKLAGGAWWAPVAYTNWYSTAAADAWIKTADDLPDVRPMLIARAPDGTDWLVLDTHAQWTEPAKAGRKEYDLPHRHLWYIIRSYLVRRADAAKFFRWAKRQDFMGRWMPEPTDIIHISLGEFFWSPVYRQTIVGYGINDWTMGTFEELPVEVLVTSIDFLYESSEFDCSLDESIRIALPAEPIVAGMGLQWAGVEGRFENSEGQLTAFDPSVFESGPGAILVRQDAFRKYMKENDLELFWTLLGEKQLIGDWSRNSLGWLEVSGAYRLTPDGIVGEFATEYRVTAKPRPQKRRRSNGKA